MNRVIKFRVWDPNVGYFPWSPSYFQRLVDWDKSQEKTDNENGVVRVVGRMLEGLVFEQFTGLKDRDGREIYEGDIIKTGKAVKQVCFGHYHDQEHYSHHGWYCEIRYPGRMIRQWCLHDAHDPTEPFDGEVIGNIHENPELLRS